MSLDMAEVGDSAASARRTKRVYKPRQAPKVALLTYANLDKRYGSARAVRELVDTITADLGGAEAITEGARQIVQRAAVLGAFLEDIEMRWIGGEPFDPAEYLPAINAQRRLLESVGLKRVARDVTPSIAAYAAHVAAQAASAAPRIAPDDVVAITLPATSNEPTGAAAAGEVAP